MPRHVKGDVNNILGYTQMLHGMLSMIYYTIIIRARDCVSDIRGFWLLQSILSTCQFSHERMNISSNNIHIISWKPARRWILIRRFRSRSFSRKYIRGCTVIFLHLVRLAFRWMQAVSKKSDHNVQDVCNTLYLDFIVGRRWNT
jgi:hypothetical protein